jgi:CRISPR system Cascade subunit CasC
MTRTIIDFHAIQSLPANNMNRDMSGLPKSSLFGGVQRARISSQAWKSAMRKHFADNEDLGALGVRTRQVAEVVADVLVARKMMTRDLAIAHTIRVLSWKANVALPIDVKKKVLKAVVFFTTNQLERLADLVWEASSHPDQPDDIKRAYGEVLTDIMRDKSLMGADVALFGRMVAADHDAGIEAASSHMHTFSTHEVEIESDEFVAVDDATGTTGSAHLGNHEHTTSTVYRFSTLDVDELVRHIGPERAVDVVGLFARAFALSVPTGRSTTFFASTAPSFVGISVRDDRPQPYANAFESPVVANGDGYVAESVARFAEYQELLTTNLNDTANMRHMSMVNTSMVGSRDSLNGIIDSTLYEVATRLGVPHR